MDRNDFINHSPVRRFEQISGGGLKPGEMGLVTSKKGLGKTSVLVQFGLDALLHDRPLVHVSFDQHSSNVISWYDSILAEIARQKDGVKNKPLEDELMRDRVILNFNQETFTIPKVINTLTALKAGGIDTQMVVIDGISLDKVSDADIKTMADFAKSETLMVWFSDTKEGDLLDDSCRAEIQPCFEIVCHLGAAQGGIALRVLKLRDKTNVAETVSLDTKTLLMK